jgi:hypothetical protein
MDGQEMELRLSRPREAEYLTGLCERLASVAHSNRVSALRLITSGLLPARVDLTDFQLGPKAIPQGNSPT